MARQHQLQELAAAAVHLRSLHVPGRPLVLPNAWDVLSARRVVEAGFPVVATASTGMAASLGYEDGEQIPADEMFAAVARVAAAVEVPVSADIEAGYGLDGATLAERLLEAGAVGCNLEDTDHASGGQGLLATEAQATRIAALRAESGRRGVAMVINARVDVFAREIGPADERVELAIARGRAYRAAGADCIYPIMLVDEAAIGALVAAFDGLVNVYARPEAPSLRRLVELGVARVSYGPWLQRLAVRAADQALAQIATGTDPY
jgi:2-methylisocitrate lyase-like PEP mutase family enzyme